MSVLDSDSVLAFILDALSGAFIGVVGGGGQTGIIARSIRTVTFSIITVTADMDIDMAQPGLTIPAIGRESTIRIVRSINATAEFQRREEDRVSRGLAGNPMRLGSTTRRPEPTKPARDVIASRGSPAKVHNAATALLRPTMEAEDTVRVLPTAEPTAETLPYTAIASVRPLAAAADTARVLPTAEATAETVPYTAIASARPMAAAAVTTRVLLTAEATAETLPYAAINPSRPMVAAADTA
jgi:hypothetical protein